VIVGGVAHNFNNLLTTIVGNASLGLMAAPEGDLTACFTAIENAAMRAAELTRQLLAYAGKGKLMVTEVVAEGLPPVEGDTTQMFQVVLNLVTNAAEAFPADAGGLVTVRTREVQVDQAAIDSGRWSLPLVPGRYVTLEVADTGTGMKPDVAARAFEPFFTTKFTGRGLGLAAVLGTLRSHRGSLKVRSDPGQGSSFKLYLPVI
jgi:signal transduction histidine kinase